MRSNIPTERIISLVEELTELSIAYDIIRDALSTEISADLPSKPPLIQYNIEINRPLDYAKRVESQRERMRRIRTKLGGVTTIEQRREPKSKTDPAISLDAVMRAIEKAEKAPLNKVKIEI